MAGKGTRKSVKAGEKKPSVTKSARCNLTFGVGRCSSMIRRGRYAESIGVGAGIYMAAVLEYITSEIMELAGENCKVEKRQRITPRHIKLAVSNDPELTKMMAETMIAEGGVLPQIHEDLFPKKKGKKNAAAAGTQEM